MSACSVNHVHFSRAEIANLGEGEGTVEAMKAMEAVVVVGVRMRMTGSK